MALKIQITSVQKVGNGFNILFNVIPSGNYVAGGDPLDFTKAVADPSFVGPMPAIEALGPPVNLDCWSAGGNLVNQYTTVQGATQSGSKLKVSAASSFGTEFSAGAYSAAILADTIQGSAFFIGL